MRAVQFGQEHIDLTQPRGLSGQDQFLSAFDVHLEDINLVDVSFLAPVADRERAPFHAFLAITHQTGVVVLGRQGKSHGAGLVGEQLPG